MTRPYNWLREYFWHGAWTRKCDWMIYYHFDEGSLGTDVRTDRCNAYGQHSYDNDYFCTEHYANKLGHNPAGPEPMPNREMDPLDSRPIDTQIQDQPMPVITQSEPVNLPPLIPLVARKKRSIYL